MCTISGLIFFGDKCLETLESFKKVIVKGEMRGVDATGISIIYYDGSIKSLKLALKASDVEERIFEFLKSNVNDLTYAVLVNNRAQPLPEGSSKDNLNNIQPVIKDNLICVHNGTVSNDRALRDKYGYTQETQIDSEVFIDLYRQFVAPADSRINGWQEILKEVAGGFALSLVDPQKREIWIMRNFKPLTIGYDLDKKFLVFSSEKEILEEGFGKDSIISKMKYQELSCYTGWLVDMKEHINDRIKTFTFENLHISSLPKASEENALVVCSGGLDSTTAAYYAKKRDNKNVTLVHFDYGQLAEMSERKAVEYFAEKEKFGLEIIDLKWLGKLGCSPLTDKNINLPLGEIAQESTCNWIPARNFVMTAITFALAEVKSCKCVYTGYNLEESGCYMDNEVMFFKKLNEISDYATISRPRLQMVLERKMKSEIIQLGLDLGVDYSKTWSCDLSGEYACGQCGADRSKILCFLKAGLDLPHKFLTNPDFPVWVTEEMKEKIKNKFIKWNG